jgi:hypothetical protein
VKKVRAETLEHINRLLLGHAKAAGVEKGRKVRIDAGPLISAEPDADSRPDGRRTHRCLHRRRRIYGFSDGN